MPESHMLKIWDNDNSVFSEKKTMELADYCLILWITQVRARDYMLLCHLQPRCECLYLIAEVDHASCKYYI